MPWHWGHSVIFCMVIALHDVWLPSWGRYILTQSKHFVDFDTKITNYKAYWLYSAWPSHNGLTWNTHTYQYYWVNSLRPRQNGHRFVGDVFKCIFGELIYSAGLNGQQHWHGVRNGGYSDYHKGPGSVKIFESDWLHAHRFLYMVTKSSGSCRR